jgi:hypothetical protein
MEDRRRRREEPEDSSRRVISRREFSVGIRTNVHDADEFEVRLNGSQNRLAVCEGIIEHIEERSNGCQEQLNRLEEEVTRLTHLTTLVNANAQRILVMERELREGCNNQRNAEENMGEAELAAHDFKQCPNCATPTQKFGGCDHMVR